LDFELTDRSQSTCRGNSMSRNCFLFFQDSAARRELREVCEMTESHHCDGVPHHIDDKNSRRTCFGEYSDLLGIPRQNSFSALRRVAASMSTLRYTGRTAHPAYNQRARSRLYWNSSGSSWTCAL